jgi:hypothetical protein
MGVPAAVNPRVFRMDHRLFRAIAFWLDFPILLVFIAYLDGLHDWPAVLVFALLLYLLIDVLCRLFVRLFPVKVTDRGIYGYSFWSLPRFLEWGEIATVRPWRVVRLDFLRLYPANRRSPIWLPLFLAHPVLFREEVWALAPPDSPLPRFLGRGARPQDVIELKTG